MVVRNFRFGGVPCAWVISSKGIDDGFVVWRVVVGGFSGVDGFWFFFVGWF